MQAERWELRAVAQDQLGASEQSQGAQHGSGQPHTPQLSSQKAAIVKHTSSRLNPTQACPNDRMGAGLPGQIVRTFAVMLLW